MDINNFKELKRKQQQILDDECNLEYNYIEDCGLSNADDPEEWITEDW